MQVLELDELVVPSRNDWSWGHGYGTRPFRPETGGAPQHRLGYGPRMFPNAPGYGETADGLFLPPGYVALGDKNRVGVDPRHMDEEFPTSSAGLPKVPQALIDHFRWRGFALDQHGRPCSPHGAELVEWCGLNTGLGFGRFFGEYPIVDVVLVDDDAMLLTKRDAQGTIFTALSSSYAINSLIGGYCLPEDFGVTTEEWKEGQRPLHSGTAKEMAKAMRYGIFRAAERLLRLKAGVTIDLDDIGLKIVRGLRPISSRHTWHFWNVVYTVQMYRMGASERITPDKSAFWAKMDDFDVVAVDMLRDHRDGLSAAISF